MTRTFPDVPSFLGSAWGRGFFALILFVGFLRPAWAGPSEDLDNARQTFVAGDFQGAVAKLTALLYPTPRLAQGSAIAEAHLLLGVSYFETGNSDSAGREFEEALFLDDTLRLESNLFSKEAVLAFERKREEIVRKAVDATERARIARQEQALGDALKNLVVFEKRRYWVNFMPFGAGQFQNGHKRKGALLFAGQALTGGTSVGLWSYQIVKYGFRGTVPRDEVNTVNTIQVVQIGTGVLFLGLVAYGIVDSLSHYEHAIKREPDPTLLRELEDAFRKDVNTSYIPRVLPAIGHETQGVTLYWEY